MTNLMQYVDICIGNEEDAEKVLGFKPEGSDVMSAIWSYGYMNIFSQMADRFGFRYIASSLRESHSASNNGWFACIMDGKDKRSFIIQKYTIAQSWIVWVVEMPLHRLITWFPGWKGYEDGSGVWNRGGSEAYNSGRFQSGDPRGGGAGRRG